MEKPVKNWIATSNYDMRTAEAMHKSGRYIYVVFMCHLAMEKMLKALLANKYPEILPPKIHNLINLAQKAEVTPPDDLKDFLQRIDNVSITTRYPEDLRRLSKEFDQLTARLILSNTRKMLKWLKQHLKSTA